MIVIALVFAAIGFVEWKSIQKSKNDNKKKWAILITVASLFVLCEVLYLFKDVFQIDAFVKLLFGPLEKMILMKK